MEDQDESNSGEKDMRDSEVPLGRGTTSDEHSKLAALQDDPVVSGPWRACHAGACTCGQIWNQRLDVPIAVVKHGPWGDSWPAIRHVDASEGMAGTAVKLEAYIERMDYGSIPETVAVRTRRLIAATPDLLCALQGLLADCVEYAHINNLHNDDGKPATNHAMRRARSAIAKATQAPDTRPEGTSNNPERRT